MKQKKGINSIKYIYMIALTGFLFINFIFIFYNLSTTILNDKQLEQELMIYNILYDCSFNQEFGKYSRDELSQTHFKNCLNEFDFEDTSMRISVDILNETYELNEKRITITLGKKEDSFQKAQKFCSIYSTKLCGRYIHSVMIIEKNNIIKNSIMHIEIIS